MTAMKKIKSISIIISVYNEEKTIRTILNKIFVVQVFGLAKEVIVVNDGSTDKTAGILDSYTEKNKFILLTNNANIGKGASLKKAFLKSTGDIVIIQDADLEYSPDDYEKLIKPIIDGHADVVYGSRFINSDPHRVLYFYHSLGNKIITSLSNIFTNLNLTDIEVGFKVFKGELIRKIAHKLKAKRFGFEPEITAKIAKISNIKIYEVGISYYGRTYEEGKKITWIDGLKTLWEILRYNLFD